MVPSCMETGSCTFQTGCSEISGTSVDDVAEVIVDIHSALVACDGRRVVQSDAVGSHTGADGASATCSG